MACHLGRRIGAAASCRPFDGSGGARDPEPMRVDLAALGPDLLRAAVGAPTVTVAAMWWRRPWGHVLCSCSRTHPPPTAGSITSGDGGRPSRRRHLLARWWRLCVTAAVLGRLARLPVMLSRPSVVASRCCACATPGGGVTPWRRGLAPWRSTVVVRRLSTLASELLCRGGADSPVSVAGSGSSTCCCWIVCCFCQEGPRVAAALAAAGILPARRTVGVWGRRQLDKASASFWWVLRQGRSPVGCGCRGGVGLP